MNWHPPAETSIPVSVLFKSLTDRQPSIESRLRSLTGFKYCAFGPSGRALLFSLLVALRGETGHHRNEVLIPGYTCYSVAAAVAKAGLKIRCYDIDIRTFAPIVESVEQRSSNRTLAILSQNLLGIACDAKPVGEIASSIGAYHIEDAAQGLGGFYGSSPLGTQGDFGLYSFGRGKPLPAGGGGAVISDNHDLRDLIRPFTLNRGILNIGVTALTRLMASPQLYWIAELLPIGLGRTIFDPGFRIGAVPASLKNLGAQLLSNIEPITRHRREIAQIYRQNLPRRQIIDEEDRMQSVYMRFPVLSNSKEIPSVLYRYGVRRLYPKAICDEKTIKSFLTDGENVTPHATKLSNLLMTLPTHSGVKPAFAKEVAKIVCRK